MKTSNLVAIVCAAVALVVSIYQSVRVGHIEDEIERLRSDRGTVSGPGATSARPSAADLGRVSGLESRIAAQDRTAGRPPALAPRPTRQTLSRPPDEATATPSPEELVRLRQDVDALLAGGALDTDQGRERLAQVVRAVQEQVSAERAQRWMEERDRATDDRLRAFVEDARLSARQEEDLTALLRGEREQRARLFEEVRGGQKPFEEVSPEIRGLRHTTDEQARQFLDDDQYQKYEAMRQQDRRGTRGGFEAPPTAATPSAGETTGGNRPGYGPR